MMHHESSTTTTARLLVFISIAMIATLSLHCSTTGDAESGDQAQTADDEAQLADEDEGVAELETPADGDTEDQPSATDENGSSTEAQHATGSIAELEHDEITGICSEYRDIIDGFDHDRIDDGTCRLAGFVGMQMGPRSADSAEICSTVYQECSQADGSFDIPDNAPILVGRDCKVDELSDEDLAECGGSADDLLACHQLRFEALEALADVNSCQEAIGDDGQPATEDLQVTVQNSVGMSEPCERFFSHCPALDPR